MNQWDIVDFHGKKVMLIEKLEDSSPQMWKIVPVYTSNGTIQTVSESELTPTIAVYEIPVSWGCFGTITVEATSIQEAMDMFEKEEDEYALPTDSDYIDGSFSREKYSSPEEAKECYARRLLPYSAL